MKTLAIAVLSFTTGALLVDRFYTHALIQAGRPRHRYSQRTAEYRPKVAV